MYFFCCYFWYALCCTALGGKSELQLIRQSTFSTFEQRSCNQSQLVFFSSHIECLDLPVDQPPNEYRIIKQIFCALYLINMDVAIFTTGKNTVDVYLYKSKMAVFLAILKTLCVNLAWNGCVFDNIGCIFASQWM